ncbi:histidine phosphatase family protein [Atopobium deltae]
MKPSNLLGLLFLSSKLLYSRYASVGDTLVAFGGERDRDAQQRICSCLTQIMQKPDHHTVLAISHGAISMLFYESAQHAEAANVSRNEWPSNASIIHYEYNGAVFCATEILEENFDDIYYLLR